MLWSSIPSTRGIHRSVNSRGAPVEPVQVVPRGSRAPVQQAADGVNTVAGKSNALCTVKRHSQEMEIIKHLMPELRVVS